MTVFEDIPIAPYTTFRLGPRARYLIELRDPAELPEAFAFARERNLPFCILGGGSNTIFTDAEQYPGVILKIVLPGFEIIEETASDALVRVGAGEDWDSVVARCVERGLSGIEALSAIPGSSGATPVQNVGAYGTEIADVLEHIDAYDRTSETQVRLVPKDCGFAYRDSRFKHEDQYVITAITLRLSKNTPRVPDYPGVATYFEACAITEPSLTEIREAIIAIRQTKLPDPKDVASVGSFFKNPFVSAETAARLKREYDRSVLFEQDDGRYKVGAGWLIDTLGLKGKTFGNLSLYPHNALVITNNGHATCAELARLVEDIRDRVRERFGIELEPEPVFV